MALVLQETMTERTIVFATDLEGDVVSGLALASGLAAEHAATLLLVHVVPLHGSEGEGMLHEAVGIVHGETQRRLRELVPPDPSVPYLHVLEFGDPEPVILDVVHRERADLLVVEEQARSSLTRAFSRSLPERLVSRSPCPVVVYRSGTGNRPSEEASVRRAPLPRHRIEVLDLLTGLLEARVEALVTWMDQRKEAVARIAASAVLRDGIASIVRAPSVADPKSVAGRICRRVALQLDEHQRALGALGVELAVGEEPLVKQGIGALDVELRTVFDAKVAREGCAISLPLDGDCGRPGSLVMLAGARVQVSSADPAMLVFTLDARRDFLRILAQPGPTPSTETYAFDRNGLMLSNSRFPNDLRRLGLLPPEPGAQAPRRLRVCEPSAPATLGDLGSESPLTRMAADATQGHDGADWRGYADYRGIEVVGAWKWVPEYEFGVAAEMDRGPFR